MTLPTIHDKNKKYVIYRDFSTDFLLHPFSSDVTVNIDEKAVLESMKNLLLTSKGERLFNPNIGGDLRSFLFENKYNTAFNSLIENRVRDTINTYEPRAIIDDLSVYAPLDDHDVTITIKYYVINSEKLNTATIVLEKIR